VALLFFQSEPVPKGISRGNSGREVRWDRKRIGEHFLRSVQRAVHRRAGKFDSQTRQLLRLAALVERRFDFHLQKVLTGMDESAMLQQLKELAGAQLIVEESVGQFAFRHALTQEAVYATLLRRERKALHQNVAETLERVYTNELDRHVDELAYHFLKAGVWAKALLYSQRAGEKAQALYASNEAIKHFTHALDAARQMSRPPPVEIMRARGLAYETAGEFDAALSDYEQVLGAAQADHAGAVEWQGFIDLGFLWAWRDYARTGEYFQRALELARKLGDPATLGRSLNRLGNWYANVEQPGEGLRYHREALGLFQRLNDRSGLAETLDLLGMTSQLNSDLFQAHRYYRRAIGIWRELADPRGVVSSLASIPLCAASYLKDLDVPATGLAEAALAAEEACRITGEIGWRAGEAYALLNLAICLGPQGEYARALDAARTGLSIAEEIEHHQWIAAAHAVLGMLHLDLLALDAAQRHLEQALASARAVGSRVWIGSTVGLLALTDSEQGKFERAEALLRDALENDMPMRTQAQRLCWYARGELALARGQAETALPIAEGLIVSAPNTTSGRTIPRLWKLRGEALGMLGETRQAETVLQAAEVAAFGQGASSLLWRIYAALGKLYQAQGRRDEAQAEYSAARRLMQTLAAKVPEEALRRNFIERGMAMFEDDER
jgi:tetratricopeptide (TPR) repeat protein